MGSSLIKLCYEDEGQSTDIRTYYIEDVLHVALQDVLIVLNKENRKISSSYVAKSMAGLLRAQLEALDNDEYTMLPVQNPLFPDQTEVFVTQPGLYRVLSSDRSSAGKKFQKWLFHEVIPSIANYGTYPPPLSAKGSALSKMAEMVAVNARMLADTIARQELLESKVQNVASDIEQIRTQMVKIEAKSNDVSLITVTDRLNERGLLFTSEQEYELWSWCENITLSKSRPKDTFGSRNRLSHRYTLETVDDGIELLKETKGWFITECV